ncbi:hypothetical protein R1flu_028241 [Riccia fluitans]|uniref:Uncharacterized protein n=1 Tax=Riccia fluitans TaxID=41844 RepID=A0ABD1XL43_9MARC
MVILASSKGWFWKDKPDSKFTRKRDMKNSYIRLLPQQQVGFQTEENWVEVALEDTTVGANPGKIGSEFGKFCKEVCLRIAEQYTQGMKGTVKVAERKLKPWNTFSGTAR